MKNLINYIKYFLFALAVMFCSAGAWAEPGVSSPEQSVTVVQPQVRVLNGQVEIAIAGDESCQVVIYALTGQVVKSFTAHPGVNTVDLPKGYYIVKCDRVSSRVVVK